MKISYNEFQPYFGVENNQVVRNSVEGYAFQSYIDKNNLTTEFIDEKWTWGRKDENGKFNGVLGRVNNEY